MPAFCRDSTLAKESAYHERNTTMRKTLLINCLLLLSVVLFGQQVISNNALSSQRQRHSGVCSPLIYAPGAQSVQSPVGVTPSYSSSDYSALPSVSPKSGRMASEIYTPFAGSVNQGVMKRRADSDDDDDDDLPGVTPGDPGTQSQNFPLGDGWVMLLFSTLMMVVIRRKRTIINIPK